MEKKNWVVIDPKDDNDVASFLIQEEPYEGAKIKFGSIKLNENDEKDACVLSFEFSVVNPEFADLENDEGFQTYLGNVLIQVLEEAVEGGEFRIGDKKKENLL